MSAETNAARRAIYEAERAADAKLKRGDIVRVTEGEWAGIIATYVGRSSRVRFDDDGKYLRHEIARNGSGVMLDVPAVELVRVSGAPAE